MSAMITACLFFSLSFSLFFLASPAFAYIGFGPGLTMIGSFFSLVATIVVLLGMVLLLPLRMLLKRRKAHKNKDANAAQKQEDSPAS